MSFPMTFELSPEAEFSFNEIVALLKASAAAQEESLSRLTDVERKKVTYILKRCEEDVNNNSMTKAAEQSVDEVLRTIGKLQVILQFRTERTEPLNELPTLPAPEPPNFPEISKPSEPSTPLADRFGLTGFAKGNITNPQDEFFNQTAALRAYIPCGNVGNRTIRYTVDGADSGIHFYAAGRHIANQADIGPRANVARSDVSKNGLVLSGQGFVRIRRPHLPEYAGRAAFTLAVNTKNGPEFRIRITAYDACAAHDSGMVTAKRSQSEMCLLVY